MTGSKAALLLLPLVLSACDSQPRRILPKTGDGPTVPNSILHPGQWEATVTENLIPGPGLATIADKIGAIPKVREFCLRPGEAATPSPEALLGRGSGSGSTCRRDVWHVDHGNISGVLLCQGYVENFREVPTRLSGSYSAESYKIDVEIRASGASFTQHLDAHRTGDCDR